MFDVKLKFAYGRYHDSENILVAGCRNFTHFLDADELRAFLHEIVELAKRCPTQPYLLADYRNVRYGPGMNAVFSAFVKAINDAVIEVCRFGLDGDDVDAHYTRVTVRTSHTAVALRSNFFASEEAARRYVLSRRNSAEPTT